MCEATDRLLFIALDKWRFVEWELVNLRMEMDEIEPNIHLSVDECAEALRVHRRGG